MLLDGARHLDAVVGRRLREAQTVPAVLEQGRESLGDVEAAAVQFRDVGDEYRRRDALAARDAFQSVDELGIGEMRRDGNSQDALLTGRDAGENGASSFEGVPGEVRTCPGTSDLDDFGMPFDIRALQWTWSAMA
jgi:hypothetical protein